MDSKDLSGNAEVISFIAAAHRFCALIEGPRSIPVSAFLRQCARLLPELYIAGGNLPDVETDSESALGHSITHEQWKRLFDDLRDYFGKYDFYLETFDPTDLEEEGTVGSSVSDDLADIHRDIKNGLSMLGKVGLNEIVWHWKFSFNIHWGAHLTDALRVIHRLVFQEMAGENEE
jgi:hypothetical protein